MSAYRFNMYTADLVGFAALAAIPLGIWVLWTVWFPKPETDQQRGFEVRQVPKEKLEK
jgi:hypothetical protein